MKHKSTLLLLAAVVIAAVVAYSLSKKPTSEELARQRKRLLADFRTAEVGTLIIEEGDRRLLCRRQDGEEWRIVEPVGVRADRWEVEGILDEFELAEKVSSVYPARGESLDLAVYGLKEPVRSVTMSGAGPGGRTWTVLVGKETGAADTVFVTVEGQEGVFGVSKDIAEKAAVTLTDLRSKKLAPRISTLELEKVTLSAAEADGARAFEVRCEKSDDRWELREPFLDLADAGEVKGLANKLYDHRIGSDDFVVDDPTRAAEYGLDEPLLTLTLEGDDKVQTVIFSRRQEGEQSTYYALHKGEPAIVRVPESLFNGLRKEPGELRERALVDLWVGDVAELVLSGPAGELTLRKEDDAWQMGGDEPTAADDGVMDQVLRALKDAEVEEFVTDDAADLGPYGLSEEEGTLVTVTGKGGRTLAELLFGAGDQAGESFYAKRAAYPAVLSVKHERYYERLTAGRLAFLDRVVMKEPRSEAVEVTVRRAAQRFGCTREDAAAEWRLAEPVQGKADTWAVGSIVGDFAHLRAEAFVAEEADDLVPFGLDEPEITVSVTYRTAEDEGEAEEPGEGEPAPGRRTRTLYVGAATEEPARGHYARLAEDGRVFVLPDYVVGHYRANLASKEVCRATDLTGLTFRSGDRTLQFAYDDEKLTWTDAGGNELEERTAEAVKEAERLLRSFDAVEVADFVEKAPALYGFDEPHLVVEFDEEATKGKQVVIGKETEDGRRYAKGPATSFVLIVSRLQVEGLDAVFGPPDSGPAAEGEPAEAAGTDAED